MNIDKVVDKVRAAVDESFTSQGMSRANWNNDYVVIPPRTSEYTFFTVPSESFGVGSKSGVLGRLVRITFVAGTAYSVGYIKGHIRGVRKARSENLEKNRHGK